MDPFDGLPTTVAQCMEKLQTNTSLTSPPRESTLRSLYELMRTSEDAITAVSCHPQSISILVSILRSDSAPTKTLAAMVIEILTRKEEMRIKILLGGCMPLLIDLLKSGRLLLPKCYMPFQRAAMAIRLVQKSSPQRAQSVTCGNNSG